MPAAGDRESSARGRTGSPLGSPVPRRAGTPGRARRRQVVAHVRALLGSLVPDAVRESRSRRPRGPLHRADPGGSGKRRTASGGRRHPGGTGTAREGPATRRRVARGPRREGSEMGRRHVPQVPSPSKTRQVPGGLGGREDLRRHLERGLSRGGGARPAGSRKAGRSAPDGKEGARPLRPRRRGRPRGADPLDGGEGRRSGSAS